MADLDERAQRGEIGGRTVRIVEGGAVDFHTYPVAPLQPGFVRIKTMRSAISPGTEMTLMGRDASNVYLHRHWNDELRLFEDGPASLELPIAFGYRSSGEVVESHTATIPVGHRVYGKWPHTEFAAIPEAYAQDQTLPDSLTWDDGVDMAQMGPICVNAVAFAEGEGRDAIVVVFGAGPVGLLTAQIARAEGARTVIVVDRLASRLAIAAGLGLETLRADGTTDVAASIKRQYGPESVTVAFECTGSSVALYEAIRVVKRRGLVVAAGFYQGDAIGLRLGDEFHHNGIRVICGQIGNIHPAHSWESLRARSIDLCETGAVVFGGLPRSTVPVEGITAGIESLSRPEEVLQVVITYD